MWKELFEGLRWCVRKTYPLLSWTLKSEVETDVKQMFTEIIYLQLWWYCYTDKSGYMETTVGEK